MAVFCFFSLPEICLLFKCRRVASVRADSVCDLYSLDRDDFDMILKKFPKMKQTMRNAAEERLAQLRDAYGPDWLENEQSSTVLLPRPSRAREYLRKVEASRSALLHSSSHSTSIIGNRSTMSSSGLQAGTSTCTHESAESVAIDIPTFTQPEEVV